MAVVERSVMLLLLVFMVGNLLGLGLQVSIHQSLGALRNRRFVMLTVVLGWVVGPALAWSIVAIVPMDVAYATGLLLLGMAPCAPFVPMMVGKAGGDLAYASAVTLLTAVGTVVFMPVAVPAFVPGLTADAWSIARPLLLYVLIPLVIGAIVRARAPLAASRLYPPVKRITGLATVLMLLGMAVVYGRDMVGAVGSFAIGSQILYFTLLTVIGYALAPGLPHNQRSVLSLAMGTRNIGAALAPLVAAGHSDPRAIVMCAIATIVTVAVAAIAAARFAGHAPRVQAVKAV